MEQEAALKLWQRSEDHEVYDPEIKKEECLNHVSKRLGTSLRKAVKEWRARGVSLGGKSHGSLKEETIKKSSRYYQKEIRSNKGDVETMKTAIYATLFHSISTDQKPQHFKCPTGKDSWCFFQAALARGEVPGPHVKHVKIPLKEAHLAKIMPIYQRLASSELLQRCISCVTQNAKESLHSIIWGKCSKETSATLRRVTIAVCEFNFGTKKSLENLQKENGLASNKQSKMLVVWRDYRRVYQRKRKRLAVYAIARKKIALAKERRNASFIKKEGITYERGGF
ncbi:uncharacterized protein TNCV_155961 [Trichonephila clavipes]|nr:uncharacterized protein TNCV_155961 [Trichonephila clavipes]